MEAKSSGTVCSMLIERGGCGVPEITVTLNEQVLVFPEASVAVHVTDVIPIGKKEPDAGVQKIVGLGQLSLTLGVK